MKENLKLEWISHPAAENPRKTVVATLFIIGITVFLHILYGPLFGLLAVAVLFLSLMPYYTPTQYTFNNEGIRIRKQFYTIEKKWHQFRSYYPDRNGVLLSPFPVPTRLENFRGIYIRFNENRDAVISFIKRKIKGTYE